MKRAILIGLFICFQWSLCRAQIEIGTGTATQRNPLGSYYGYERSSALYTAEEITMPGIILNLAWYAEVGGKGARPLKVYLKETADSELTATNWETQIDGAVLVYEDSIEPVEGWNTLVLTTPFWYTGSANNLVVLVEANFGNGGNGAGANGNEIRYSVFPNKHLYFNRDYSVPTVNGTLSSYRPNLRIHIIPADNCVFPLLIQHGEETVNSIKFTWRHFGESPAWGTEYYLSTSPDVPDDNSEVTGSLAAGITEVVIDELIEGVRYYIWFRSRCSATEYSDWTDGQFFYTLRTGQIGIGEHATNSLPIQSDNSYTYSQQIYSASEVTAALGTYNYIKKIKFYFSTSGATDSYKDWKIFMGNTAQSNFAGTAATNWISTAGLTSVFDGVVSFPTNPEGDWMEIDLAEPFLWNGTSNIVVAVHEYTPGNESGARFRIMETGDDYRGMLYRTSSVSYNPNPDDPPTAIARFKYVPQIVLSAEPVPGCVGVTSYSSDEITVNAAKLLWTNLQESLVATDYFVGNSLDQWPADTTEPTGTVAIPVNEVVLQDLASDTEYYVWFRNQCTPTENSGWSGVPLRFKTLIRGFIGQGEATNSYLPLYSLFSLNYTQQIYLKEELRRAFGTSSESMITQLQFHFDSANSTDNYKDWKIFIGNTTVGEYEAVTSSDWISVETMQEVFDGEVTFPNPTNNWMAIPLTEPFAWDGNSNIVVAVQEYTPGYTSGATFRKMDTPTAYRALSFYSDYESPDVNDPPTPKGRYKYVPQIIFSVGEIEVPDCLKPIYVGVYNVDKHSATIRWTAPIHTPTQGYEFEIRTSGEAGSGPEGRLELGAVNNSTLTLNFTELADDTEYFVYIRSKCTLTSYSGWTRATTFVTRCEYPDFITRDAELCGQGIATLEAWITGATGVIKWYDVPSGGRVLGEGLTFTTPIITRTKSYWAQGLSGSCLSDRQKVDVVVTPGPFFALSDANMNICEGDTSALVTVISDLEAYDSYTWSPDIGVEGNPQSGWTFSPTVNTTYELKAKQNSGKRCEAVRKLNVTVRPRPQLEVSPEGDNTVVCKGDIHAFNVSYNQRRFVEVGRDATTNTETENNSAFINRWSSGKSQLLFTAEELTQAGLVAGWIKSIAFSIQSLGSGALNRDYMVRIATTELTEFLNVEVEIPDFVTVYGPSDYTHTSSGWQEIEFENPFDWDGTSNIIVEISSLGANLLYNAKTRHSVTPTNTLRFQYGTYGTPTLSNKRYNVKFKAGEDYAVTWEPVENLYIDQAATMPYWADFNARYVYYKGQTEGTENLQLHVISENGCERLISHQIRTVLITDAVVEDQVFCAPVRVSDLAVSGQEGAVFKWYRRKFGGEPLSPDAELRTADYYVAQVIGDCVSDNRMLAHITVYSKPVAPVCSTRIVCHSGMLSDLEVIYDAQHNTLKWYDANFDEITGDIALQTGNYYVSQSNSTCESDRVPVVIEVNPIPVTPTAEATQQFCGEARVSSIAMALLEGATPQWYSSAVATTPLSLDAYLTSGTYYGAQRLRGCESNRVAVAVLVQRAVAVPVVENQSFCNRTVTIVDLEAATLPDGQWNWYNTAVGGAVLSPDHAVGSGTYYVARQLGDCESARKPVIVNLVSNRLAPQAVAQSFCGAATVADLEAFTATGMTVNWYQQSEGGRVLTEETLLQTGTYYVSQTIYHCESPRRPVAVVVNPIPATPTGDAVQKFETINPIVGDLRLDQEDLWWFSSEEDALNNIRRLAENTPLNDNYVYYATVRSPDNCFSLPFAVQVVITMGITDYDATKLEYHPNPVKDVLTISSKEIVSRVEVYALTGQQILTVEPATQLVLVDMSQLANATYLVKIYTETGGIQAIKIVKR
ncbi:T9SS type A sorting domain-containing protein [Flavobacterium sp. JP2137]|uniref:Ig-like domain-containing protein n=1 Tax=Flavobacterium sp. JP2137 TaxID=3414510 RepID=UPI003D2FD375